MVARIMYRQLGSGCGPLSKCAHPKIKAGGEQRARAFAESLHQQVLDQRPEQNLFRQRRAA